MNDALRTSEAVCKKDWDEILRLSTTLFLKPDPYERIDDRIARVFEFIEDSYGFDNEEDVMTWTRHMVHFVNKRVVRVQITAMPSRALCWSVIANRQGR